MGGLLPAVKHPNHASYGPHDTSRSEAALLTVWARLADFHEDLVLVGGLVPRYLCRPSTSGFVPNTLDVDFAIALAAGGGMYEPLRERLRNEGFAVEQGRFRKEVAGAALFIDFLTERPTPEAPESAIVDDFAASAFFGVDRALNVFRLVTVEGRDLHGAEVRETVKVCEIGPFLCLKLQAYAQRAEPKDVFDVIHAVQHYDGGATAAVRAFAAERGSNLAFPISRQMLIERFADERAKGPVDYARFCLGEAPTKSSDEERLRRATLANDAVTVAQALSSGSSE